MRMHRLLSALPLVVAAGILAGAGAARADIAFVESSSELDGGKPATSMWNAVDGKDTTSWCTKKDDNKAYLSFGFQHPVTVTHIALVVGAKKGDALDKTRKRARVVVVSDSAHRVEAKFKDDPGLQTLELTPPARGERIVVEFPEVYDGKTPDAPLCLAEVVLKDKGEDLTGASVATKLRGLNTPEKRLLHRWLDDVSAPTRTLTFSLDGTFSYVFEPLLEGTPAKVRGKWNATGRAVVLTVGDKTLRMKSRLTRVDDAKGDTVELTLDGDAPTPSMDATYRPAPSKLP